MPSPLYAARRVRRALAQRNEDVQPSGELNIVPFLDIVTNLLLFLLATVGSVLVVTQVDAQLRPFGPGTARDAPATVSVTLTRSGAIVVAGPGGRVAPGCDALADTTAPTVPSTRGGEYDFAALSSCMVAVHARVADDRVILSADPDVAYEHVVRAMDTVRSSGDRPLFPDVMISVGVR